MISYRQKYLIIYQWYFQQILQFDTFTNKSNCEICDKKSLTIFEFTNLIVTCNNNLVIKIIKRMLVVNAIEEVKEEIT